MQRNPFIDVDVYETPSQLSPYIWIPLALTFSVFVVFGRYVSAVPEHQNGEDAILLGRALVSLIYRLLEQITSLNLHFLSPAQLTVIREYLNGVTQLSRALAEDLIWFMISDRLNPYLIVELRRAVDAAEEMVDRIDHIIFLAEFLNH